MTDFFTITIQWLESIGFFKFFLPYILTAAIFYGLLRKSKIFGEKRESIVINATISFSAALFVAASPILVGIDLSKPMSQILTFSLLVFLVVLVLIFVPLTIWQDQFLRKISENRLAAIGMIIFIIVVAVLLAIFIFFPIFPSIYFSEENITSLVALAIFFIILLVVVSPFSGKK
jgi:uncharacterized membrane protein YjfL (UPF0719 family)